MSPLCSWTGIIHVFLRDEQSYRSGWTIIQIQTKPTVSIVKIKKSVFCACNLITLDVAGRALSSIRWSSHTFLLNNWARGALPKQQPQRCTSHTWYKLQGCADCQAITFVCLLYSRISEKLNSALLVMSPLCHGTGWITVLIRMGCWSSTNWPLVGITGVWCRIQGCAVCRSIGNVGRELRSWGPYLECHKLFSSPL